MDKDEIIAAVWRDVAVTDDSLIHSISVIRRALGDDPTHPSYVETIPRRGYRFVGFVEPVESAREPASAEEPSEQSPTGITPESAHSVRWTRRGAIAAAVLLLLAAAIPLCRAYLGRNASTDAAIRVQQVAPPGTTIVSRGVVSPTGRHLAFVARDEQSGRTAVWVLALDSPEPRRVPGTGDASRPFFSPDGQMIAFFLKGRLLATDLNGKAVRTIAIVDGAPAGGSWGAKDVIVFADWTTGLYSVAATGGPVAPLTRLDHAALDVAHAWPQFLPDGRRFLYQVMSVDSSRAGVYAGSIDAPGSVRLLDKAVAAAYAPPGFLLYQHEDMLIAESFDPTRLALGGHAVLLARGVSPPSLSDGNGISGAHEMLAFREGAQRQRLMWVDRSGAPHGALDVPTSMFNFRLSPDSRLLIAASSLTDTTGLWLVDRARRQSTRLEADGIAPLWSPDGSSIAFTARAGLDLYVRTTTGAGRGQLMVSDRTVKVLNDWSPDGRSIVYTQHGADTKLDLWLLPLSGGSARPVLTTAFNEAQARISPDGRWIAYVSDESDTSEVYVRRYPEMNDAQLISVGGGGQPQWRADQKELFYLSQDRSLMAVTVTVGNRLSFGAPQRLFRASFESGPSAARDSYVVMADGQSFLIDARENDNPASPITMMLNWTAGLAPGITPEIVSPRRYPPVVAVR